MKDFADPNIEVQFQPLPEICGYFYDFICVSKYLASDWTNFYQTLVIDRLLLGLFMVQF